MKIICLYQVVMHYRVPFYERLSNDDDFEFKLLYGRGKKLTKLVNAKIEDKKINAEQLYDVRVPMPFSPLLFFKLIKEKPSIVFTEGSSSLINSSIAFFYSKLFRKKFIWWSLGALKDKKYKGFRKLINKWELYIERNSDAIFTYSTQGEKYFLSRGIGHDRIFVAVNVFDTNAKLQEIKSTSEQGFLDSNFFNIGFIGSIEKTKNLELLIEVVHLLNQKYGNIKLHVIGDGEYLTTLKSFVQNEHEVVFYGRINYGASKILGNCDVFVLPGLGGLAICEAMLNELPIITGNADGTEYDLVDHSNGFIIEDMNVKNLYDKIEFLYKNTDILKDMKYNSLRKITEEVGFENYYAVFKKMINHLTDNKDVTNS